MHTPNVAAASASMAAIRRNARQFVTSCNSAYAAKHATMQTAAHVMNTATVIATPAAIAKNIDRGQESRRGGRVIALGSLSSRARVRSHAAGFRLDGIAASN